MDASESTRTSDPAVPTIIPRPDHDVSRAAIDDNALKVLYRLHNAGYDAYLVGGGVRDILLGERPKDFDVVTDARPEEVKDLFRNCRLIGRRFRLAHVHFGRDFVEVATFRALHDPDTDEDDDVVCDADGRILRDNRYGTLEEDVWRRDLTVNALYYNIADFSIVDFVGGMDDIRDRIVRLIGDPETRYREDPVRMLRTVRFAAKLLFQIHPETAKPLFDLADLLRDIPPARLFDECLKLFLTGHGRRSFEALTHFGLIEHLFPIGLFEGEEAEADHRFIAAALDNTDARVRADKPVTPAFLYGAFLWAPVRRRAAELEAGGMPPVPALARASREIGDTQQRAVALPRRFATPMNEIFQMQRRLERSKGQRALRLLGHPRFRAAYDFLLLRARVGEAEQELADFWTELQEVSEEERQEKVAPPRGRNPRRRRGGDGGAG